VSVSVAKQSNLGFDMRQRLAFTVGVLLICLGVGEHVQMFIEARPMHYQLVGMGVSLTMILAMVGIVVGLAAAGWALASHSKAARRSGAHAVEHLESETLGRAHYILLGAAVLALAIDVMKPATIAFVIPGMRTEYGISKGTAALLPLVALTGTAIGSLIWGVIADRIGRQPTILFAGLMFMATSICGAMPTFEWNLAMCWLMGMAAGGFLPVMMTLVTETAPRRLRGLILVLIAGLGSAAGFLAASGLSSLLIPTFGWRIMWLIGLPTGLMLIPLRRAIPESYRFLRLTGRDEQAEVVARRFGLRPAPTGGEVETQPAPAHGGPVSVTELARSRYGRLSAALVVYAVSWGLINYGFFTWLPTMLGGQDGVKTASITPLIAKAALIALPCTPIVAVLYQRWSPKRTLVASAAATALGLAGMGVLSGISTSSAGVIVSLVLLLVAVNGMNALVLPYAAEVYPTELRARGAGLVASAGKFGGVVGTVAVSALVALTTGAGVVAFALLLPIVLGLAAILRYGIDTRGHALDDRVGAQHSIFDVRPELVPAAEE
jgi:putative MFS transporter